MEGGGREHGVIDRNRSWDSGVDKPNEERRSMANSHTVGLYDSTSVPTMEPLDGRYKKIFGASRSHSPHRSIFVLVRIPGACRL